MSILDFHASLSNQDNSALDSLRCLTSVQGMFEDDPQDGWIPWSN